MVSVSVLVVVVFFAAEISIIFTFLRGLIGVGACCCRVLRVEWGGNDVGFVPNPVQGKGKKLGYNELAP
jgi:hypothetical protein